MYIHKYILYMYIIYTRYIGNAFMCMNIDAHNIYTYIEYQ